MSGPALLVHPFGPVFDSACTRLVLGSFPSAASRAVQFYYGHPQNRFWKVLAGLYEADVPETVEEKKAFLLSRRIALWDAAASCSVTGSSDASIRSVYPNDIASLLEQTAVHTVFCNGQTACRIYESYRATSGPASLPQAVPLPSTSPANAAWSLSRLTEAWKAILETEN